eukprot:3408512-Amphidinium_carterae.2
MVLVCRIFFSVGRRAARHSRARVVVFAHAFAASEAFLPIFPKHSQAMLDLAQSRSTKAISDI